MQKTVLITLDGPSLEALIFDAVDRAIKINASSSTSNSVTRTVSKKIDFQTARAEYYPGIPESTVRQATAHLSRFKVGKRILLDRDEIEQDQLRKRSEAVNNFELSAEENFNNHHGRGGRKRI